MSLAKKEIELQTIESLKDVILTGEELKNHAKEIAKQHKIYSEPKPIRPLIKKLDQTFSEIVKVYKELSIEAQNKKPMSPASEWLLDNFYKVEEQVKEVRLNLLKDRFLKLYTIKSGVFKGYPRVYALLLDYISHTDGKIEEETLMEFIKGYQSQRILSIGEIWSISLMARIALIKNINIICRDISQNQKWWRKAEELAKEEPEKIIQYLQEKMEFADSVSPAFVEHLLRQLRRMDTETGDVVSFLEKKLSEFNTSIQQLLIEEHREQAARKISIGNSIISLNTISTLDWNDIFESLNVVEKILRNDPLEIYEKMDFESRDYYRTEIERLSNKLNRSETKIAQVAVDLAQRKWDEGYRDKYAHVGFYIIDEGVKELTSVLKAKGLKTLSNPLGIYITPIISLTLGISLCFLFITNYYWNNIILSLLFSLSLIIPVSDVVVHLINYLLLKIYHPKILPRLEFKTGVGRENATFIIVPTLLPNIDRVKELVRQLETHYQGNKDPNFYFALLADLKDSKEENCENDQEIINCAVEEIKQLNEKYGENRFFLYIRKRVYSSNEGKWMGWERKRGAVEEFNNLLLGSNNTTFNVITGIPKEEIKYVITLDADTQLPISTGKKLVGIIAHPLNKAIIGENNIVKEGYGIIQPRIGVAVESSNKTFFSKVYGGQGGIDPYTTASSDIYQDLFSHGIFTGKGIYDLKVFGEILHKNIPENSVLSHDLLEGCYLRTGLATDVELIDGYPAKFSSYIMRLHRWVRGDWQLLPWLFSKVRDRENNWVKNPLSTLSKWKIFDNLRRSLVPVKLLIFFIMTLLFVDKGQGLLLFIGLFIAFFPALLNTIEYFRVGQSQKGYNGKTNVRKFYGVSALWYQVILNFCFLPYQGYMLLDAITRTLFRVFVTKKNMLEWVTAADQERSLQNDLKSYFVRMKSGLIITLITIFGVLFFIPQNIVYALPIVFLWAVSPYIAYKISQDISFGEEKAGLSGEDFELLRELARKTWSYYEDFANETNNYLPPDNYQVYPPKGLANRTSPTNIGCMLVGVIIAKDFGYLTVKETLQRLENTLKTVEKLETWHGHLYNWYDTNTLEVLKPAYVSTVDSGNFISNLIVIKEALEEFGDEEIFCYNKLLGLRDTALLAEVFEDSKMLFMLENTDIKTKGLGVTKYNEVLEGLKGTTEQGYWQKKYNSMLQEFRGELEEFYLKDQPNEYVEFPKIETLLRELDNSNTINKLKGLYKKLLQKIEDEEIENQKIARLKEKIIEKLDKITVSEEKVKELLSTIETIIEETEFIYLYDSKRNLFSIGYNVDDERLTNSYYDLLASEARTTSYLAISKGEIPKKHWFKLGRGLSIVDGSRSLVSWTGTMFEYFMPNLLLKNYRDTLLDETYKGVILAQKKYAKKRKVPWGVSESGYYTFDLALNYQYKAFGIPELGLKRGLTNDTVISPYACILAISFDPKGVIENLKKLLNEGLGGQYGLYEAVDYTPARSIIHGKDKKIVKSFMAHHQGMILMALDNFLYDNILQKRFHQNPMIRAGETLLQERVPVRAVITKEFKEVEDYLPTYVTKGEELIREYQGITPYLPSCHIITNGRYSVMLNERGGGYSKCLDNNITRWREDSLIGKYGTYIIFKKDDKLWSAGYEPLGDEGDSYKVKFYNDKALYYRHDDNITTKMEVTVSSEDNVEIRKITLSNHNVTDAAIEVTSFMELVLGNHLADLAHPAFSNLFLRTEMVPEYECLIASRRPREEHKGEIWGFHTIVVNGQSVGGLQYETMRGNFIGRGKNIKNAIAYQNPLTDSTGIVLDPCFSLRKKVHVPAGGSVQVTFITGIGDSKDEVLDLAKKYRDFNTIIRSFDLAYTRSQVEMSFLDIKKEELKIYQDMISSLIYLSPAKERYREIIKENNRNQTALWSYGISGDLPIVLLVVKNSEEASIFQSLLKAHEYWTSKGLKVDLVVLNEEESSYLQPLQQMLNDMVSVSHGRHLLDTPGGVFIRNAKQMAKEDVTLLYSVARIIIHGDKGALSRQIEFSYTPPDVKEMEFLPQNISYLSIDEPLRTQFYNGYGGFSEDGLEYIIRLKEEKQTPAPWINVIANKKFGFLVSESGSGFIWGENSRENKITPWSNDPVSDPSEEVICIRDDQTGKIFTPTPLPVREKESYTVRHGIGYTTFNHNSNGINQELTVFVPEKDSVKISLLKLKNGSGEKRKLTITYYLKPVLGVSEQTTKNYIITEFCEKTQSLVVKNPYNIDFSNGVAFITSSEKIDSYTGDRREFIGLTGDMSNPLALKYQRLSNKVGAGLEPCAAIQTTIELKALAETELTFITGYDVDGQYLDLATKYKSLAQCKNALKGVTRFWQGLIRKIQIQTPDQSMDLMLNGWLVYQTLSCRIWARSAFYQSGGAYGFRDQLQDAMNLVFNLPTVTREQILLHCAHQFVEGDVQHWWHPGAGDKGIRTRFSDDLLWLPLVTADYVKRTGDFEILKEEVHFLEDEPLGREDERYGIPRISMEKASVYEHCIRAIERSLKFGERGIPLMGSGDWNDGMSTVGNKGKGESVWLGWFLYKILQDFKGITEYMGESDRAARYEKIAEEIVENIEKNAWDGQWYLRAFYDNGKPLGSSQNTECIIDSLGQTWSIISGGGKNTERIQMAMDSVEKYLIKRDQGLIQLFTPPFDKSDQQPGYIKGYVPGVRENGGQYTHAAIWVILAYALKGDGDKAWELFNLVNPINHSRTPIEASTYKVEPYVIAADVYAVAPHIGRGGWTWYTGAAGWMYRVGLEHIIGFKLSGDKLTVDPCIPKDWQEYTIKYNYGETSYLITVRNPEKYNKGVKEVFLDGNLTNFPITLQDDGMEHNIEVIMGRV
ncbi:GH36-type glycosyl hydrolase domain-containing protein [Anaerobranca gottschalkii]|uniref:Cellobiose phosphorylase n=1 Tax=Anaerobranca gottschalkii DSM 13577 TaxID=1120990 RepID=A0A1H9YMY2_9FIRM|nr:glucoamylase family protein [Anaerobranca gottschalkii]SES70409.1 Cellobiose phosphorylase [Anaerobranca gottschalkii DSM 13577]